MVQNPAFILQVDLAYDVALSQLLNIKKTQQTSVFFPVEFPRERDFIFISPKLSVFGFR